MHNVIEQFRNAIYEAGITPPKDIVPDNVIHRFHIQGDKVCSKTGWYVLFADQLSCGVFGSWKSGITSKWCVKKRSQMSNQEFIEYKIQIANAQRQRDEERAIQQKKAAQIAEKIWYRCVDVNPMHPYLVNKRVKPFYARQSGTNLVLPIINFAGEFSSLQFISEDGSKRFLTNGKITGNYIPIQKQPLSNRPIMLAESFSTAASIAQAYPNVCVIAACHASNLKPVAVNFRQNLREVKMIICADDDRHLAINIGLIKAREAAIAANALFTKPEWPEGAPTSLTDFNDLANWFYHLETTNE